MSIASDCEHVRVVRSGGTGRLVLDRPASLNALTLPMIRTMSAALDAWEADDDLHVVLIDSASPRAFCAGGDIRAVYESARTGDGCTHVFWTEQYRLDRKIARYEKPVVAIMSGIVMGGGVGLSAHARHRIVDETTKLAMPEVGIGLIPDVGGTWLLSRTPGSLGTYLALTGATVGAADAIAMDLAEHFVAHARMSALVTALMTESPSTDTEIRATIRRFASSASDAIVGQQRVLIDSAFGKSMVEEIVAALNADDSPFARAASALLETRSPTSLKLTLRALAEARTLDSLEACLRLEFRVMSHRLEDFDVREGVRAAVIDKDRKPAWQPAHLAEVSLASLDPYFASLGSAELVL